MYDVRNAKISEVVHRQRAATPCHRHPFFLHGGSKSLCLCQKHPSYDTHMQISAFLLEQSINVKINPKRDLSPSGSMNISISGSISYWEDTWCLRIKKLFRNNSLSLK